MSFLKELFNSMARVIGRIIAYLIIGFLLFYFFNNKVEAASYYFDYPRINTICNNDRLGICTEASGNGISTSDNKIVGNPNGLPIGNYVNVIYRYDQNINGVTGTNFIAGNYSVSLKYQIRLVEGTEVPKNLIKVRLIYYPDNSNQYAYATCDNNENITITNAFNDPDMFNISYTCETIQITEGKSFLGFNIKLNIDDPFGLGSRYIKYGEVITNLTLIGEGEATNNDIINNQNQNQQQTNQGLQDIEDAILDTSQPNLDGFNYTDSTGGLISTFLTMPITLLRVMNNVDACRVVTLGELFGTPLRFDCINPGVFLGETLWNIIDYFIVFTMISSIAQLFIYVYEKFKNLDDFFNEFYTPQHMAPDEYVPRHGGGK